MQDGLITQAVFFAVVFGWALSSLALGLTFWVDRRGFVERIEKKRGPSSRALIFFVTAAASVAWPLVVAFLLTACGVFAVRDKMARRTTSS